MERVAMDDEPLLSEAPHAGRPWNAARAHRDFFVLSLCIAAMEGSSTAIQALSAALIDPHVFSLTVGCMYISYVLGSLCAPLVTVQLGLANSSRVGLAGGFLYAVAFLVRWPPLLVAGALVAGASFAAMWTAQGVILSRSAAVMAREWEGDLTVQTRRLSGVFATAFPLALTACKLLSTLVLGYLPEQGATIVYSLYSLFCLLALLLAIPLRDPPSGLAREPNVYKTRQLAFATMQLLSDPMMLLMVPTNAAFGLCTAFFPSVVSRAVGASHGESAIGLLYAFTGLSEAVFAHACAWLTTSFTWAVPLTMFLGAASFFTACAVALLPDFTAWPVLITSFILYGCGQAVWTGPCMALFGAYWPCNPQAAYSNLKLHSGVASASAFLVYPCISVETSGSLCIAVTVVGFVCYMLTSVKTDGKCRRNCRHKLAGCICKDEEKKCVVLCCECQDPGAVHAIISRTRSTELLRRSEPAWPGG